jgi:hypothetical protein
MDIALAVGFLLTLFIFEPGNEKINAYCKASLAGETEEVFTSRKDCWDYYDDFREDIPNE